MTPAEDALWTVLRARGLDGWKFRRQHPVGRFVIDFYCAETGVAVELDGGVHLAPDQRLSDSDRQKLLEEQQITFIRVPNGAVFNHLDSVLKAISRACAEAELPLSASARRGGRGVRS